MFCTLCFTRSVAALPLQPRRSPQVIWPQLTHNAHGPHDDSFYKYLAGLEAEYEDLRRSGYSGEGFHSRGVRLGVGTSHNLPPHSARLKALEAAEKRRAGGSGGGRRLGGGQAGTFDGGRIQFTPRELALKVSLVLPPLLGSPILHPSRNFVKVPAVLTINPHFRRCCL